MTPSIPGRARLLRRQWMALALCACLPCPATPLLDAPNVVEISELLVTSGQPTVSALSGLGHAGFQAVVYLAPGSVPDAIADEPEIVRRQGIEFVHIPIPFNAPTKAHVAEFTQTLQRLRGRKVLVHCQVNMRASSMVFLYRTLALYEDPSRAYASVTAVWSPRGPWRELIVALLREHRIAFDPL